MTENGLQTQKISLGPLTLEKFSGATHVGYIHCKTKMKNPTTGACR